MRNNFLSYYISLRQSLMALTNICQEEQPTTVRFLLNRNKNQMQHSSLCTDLQWST